MSVDATAIKQSHEHVIATVPEPSVTFERDELQHKLERREMELKRKDKELELTSREVGRLQKEVKAANAEITSLRDRNEQLQQSLMNARLANQNARDDADARLSESRIRELELALSTSIHKTSKIENELESAKQVVASVDARILALNNQIETLGRKEKEALENLYKTSMQCRTAQNLYNEREKEATQLRDEKYSLEHQLQINTDALNVKTRDNEDISKELADMKKRVTDLTKLLNVRSETNAMLRQQVEEINGTKFVITKDEMDRLKKVERDNAGMQMRIKELVKSVDLHMDLLSRAETESNKTKDALKQSTGSELALKRELGEIRQSSGAAIEKLKAATKELIKLRRDNKDLVIQVEEMRSNPNAGKPEYESMREQLAMMGKSKNDTLELQLEEAKKRKSAEESTKAMRNRISFLLEQLEQASSLSSAWQEQKAILKAEISSLHSTNKDLRIRLSSVQGYYTERNIITIAENDSYGDYDGIRNRPSPADVLSGKSGLEISALGQTFENPAANTMPTSVESYVERALFDTICAFSSGSKTSIFKAKKKGQTGPMNMFRVKLTDEGVLAIEANTEDPDMEVEARELLTGLQINAFLRFCQTRPPGKTGGLYTEKIANILNQSRNRITEVVEQLGDTRMEVARATARAAVSMQRVQRLRDRFYFERLAKQKNIIKYVREQMRHSDMRIILNDINSKAADYILEFDIAMNNDQRQLKEFMQQVTHTCLELSGAVSSSGTTTGPPGSMEIRLPDTQLDDETMHGVIGLLSGVLDERSSGSAGQGPTSDSGKMSTTAITSGPTSLLSSSLLTKTVLSSSPNYMNRVLQINIKGNQLTDLSCKLLSNIVETSPDLRVLDLRENCISTKGAKILFDATRRNTTVLYVTQRQGGFMIEGHREIAGGVTPAYRERVASDSQVEFERLVGTVKHPLRIDIRHNDANPAVLEGALESAMLNPVQHKEGLSSGYLSGPASSSSNLYEDQNEVAVGQWSASGLIDTVRKQSHQERSRPSSSAATSRRTPTQFEHNQSSRPSVRPQSAIVGGRDRSMSPAVEGGMGVSVGARALLRTFPKKERDDERDSFHSDSETPRSARGHTAEHDGLIAMIESGTKASRSSGGVVMSGGGSGTGNAAVGSLLDESIRLIQETEGIMPSSSSKSKTKKKKTVNEMILTDTKRVYNNKMHFPGEEEALAVIEARKRAAQASMSAGGGGVREREETRKKSASASLSTQGEIKGGGSASAMAASAVRNRLNAAKEQESKMNGSSNSSGGRPLSATVASSSSKKSSAHSLLGGIQKLNPASLF